MNKLFADSFFFLALMNRRDEWHKKAIEAIDAITGPIFTTQWVLVEVADAFCKPRDRGLFARLLELVDADDRIHVVAASNSQFLRGTELYFRRPDQSWSLTDCISFVVMEQRKIKEALTGNGHFEQAGFVALLRAN